ncbi:MAG TPA: von Willebrand factor type A domain-containing protein, partial [Chryseolinea sp.]|nr:von Willebrand factor type A domain-containing protein [Chryseolinea sp.]
MKKSIWILATLLLIMLGFTPPQGRTITGKVTSQEDGTGMPGVNVLIKGTKNATVTNAEGDYNITISAHGGALVFSFVGYITKEIKVGTQSVINVNLEPDLRALDEVVVIGYSTPGRRYKKDKAGAREESKAIHGMSYEREEDYPQPQWNTEEYDAIEENVFREALKNPLSTFSIDVDAASYSNVRRFINNGQRPPKDAERIEELINYFDYDYAQPEGEDPFAIHTEISAAPWNKKHQLVHIGLQGKAIPTENLPPSNLVFLIDVSGSMEDPNKLPLLKTSFKMLVEQLRPQDHIAIVVYAGAAGLV